jgi:hypothetical protein
LNLQDKQIEDEALFFNVEAGEGLFKLRALSFTMNERQGQPHFWHILNIKNKYA